MEQVADDFVGVPNLSPEAVGGMLGGVSKRQVFRYENPGLPNADGVMVRLRFMRLGPQTLRTSKEEVLRFVRELNAPRTLPVNIVPKPADVDGPAGELVELDDDDDRAEDALAERELGGK